MSVSNKESHLVSIVEPVVSLRVCVIEKRESHLVLITVAIKISNLSTSQASKQTRHQKISCSALMKQLRLKM